MSSTASDMDVDFVFIDINNNPCRVRKFGDHYWVFRKTAANTWVTLRKIDSVTELWNYEAACIEWRFSSLYEFGIPFTREGWPSRD